MTDHRTTHPKSYSSYSALFPVRSLHFVRHGKTVTCNYFLSFPRRFSPVLASRGGPTALLPSFSRTEPSSVLVLAPLCPASRSPIISLLALCLPFPWVDECPTPLLSLRLREKLVSLFKSLLNLHIYVMIRRKVDIRAILEPLAYRLCGQKKAFKNYIELIVNTNQKMRSWTLWHKELVIGVLTKSTDEM